jgi:hypothetical protein
MPELMWRAEKAFLKLKSLLLHENAADRKPHKENPD